MKKITIDGRLGKDAEVKVTVKGTQYLKFTVANDVYSNGENKTEWFDVTTFDPFIINNKANFLKKGRYVIITGTLTSSVNATGGKIYLNQNIMADSVDTPSFGSPKHDDSDVQTASVYSPGVQGGTALHQAPEYQPQPQVRQQPLAEAQVNYPQQAVPTPQPAAQAPYQPQPQAYSEVGQQWTNAQPAGPAQYSGPVPSYNPSGADDDLPF